MKARGWSVANGATGPKCAKSRKARGGELHHVHHYAPISIRATRAIYLYPRGEEGMGILKGRRVGKLVQDGEMVQSWTLNAVRYLRDDGVSRARFTAQ